MSRYLQGGVGLLVVAGLVGCNDTTGPQPQLANSAVSFSSGSGGGSGGGSSLGGGGGGGSVRRCAILSLAIINNVTLGTTVASFWQPNNAYVAQVAGTTEKSCDAIGNASIKFEDVTGANLECQPVLTSWVNNPGYLNPKYGAKPMSRFREGFIYYTGPNCIGHSRKLKATLTDPSPGGAVSTATLTWTP